MDMANELSTFTRVHVQRADGRAREQGLGGGGEGGATALQSKRPEWAASADPGARTAPHWGRRFRQGHRLEQADQG